MPGLKEIAEKIEQIRAESCSEIEFKYANEKTRLQELFAKDKSIMLEILVHQTDLNTNPNCTDPRWRKYIESLIKTAEQRRKENEIQIDKKLEDIGIRLLATELNKCEIPKGKIG